MAYLFPSLSVGGRRSLIQHLITQRYLRQELDLDNQPVLSLTSFGNEALRAQFPVVYRHTHGWDGSWSLLAFLEAPMQDANFRYLRSKLLSLRAGQLSRGTYLYPGELNHELKELLTNLYKNSVNVMKISEWSFGDEPTIIRSIFKLSDIFSLYSGISSEIDKLPVHSERKKELTDKQKQQLYDIYLRLYDPLCKDIGILRRYFSLKNDGLDLLLMLQNKLKL
jgi:DNA-binding transcriptional regulator PaaX